MTDDDRDVTVSIFHQYTHWEAPFKILEIELSFMYDFLHTKAMILYSRRGVVRRLITLAISSVVLIVFSCLVDWPRRGRSDLGATFLVLGVIVLLDVYSVLAMLTSDWTLVWLSKKETGPKFGLDRVVPYLPKCFKQVRWSNSMGQLSFLSSCTKRNSLPCQSILERLHIQGQFEKHYHVRYQEVLNTMKRAMLDYIWVKYYTRKEEKAVYDLSSCLAGVMKRFIGSDIEDLEWSTEMEFDKCILVWHVATELYYDYCCLDEQEEHNKRVSDRMLSNGETSYNLVAKMLSHYLYYLLVLYPFTLPSGTGQIRVRDTCAEARKFFKERGLWSKSTQNLQQLHGEACKLLLEVNTEVPPNKVKGERSKSVLFDGCRLATGLIKKLEGNNIESKTSWRMIAEIWMEILAIAASQCTGESHALQLRRGGELLTFEWLLLAHFGMTNHFQMTKGHAIAKLILH